MAVPREAAGDTGPGPHPDYAGASRRVALLERVAFTAQQLAGETPRRDVIDAVLERVGRAAGAEVARVCESGSDEAEHFAAALRSEAGGSWTDAEIDALRALAGLLGSGLQRRRAEPNPTGAEERLQTLLNQIPAVLYVDPPDGHGNTTYVSPQVEEILGIAQEAYLADPGVLERQLHPDDRDEAMYAHRQFLQTGRPDVREFRFVRDDERIVWIRDRRVKLRDENGDPTAIQGTMLDVTEVKEAERRLEHMSRHDDLTGLPNRAMFYEHLQLAVARARRTRSAVGVLFLDLDNFKLINDGLGYEAGDRFLAQVADRLRDVVRETDLVARQGGDEFLVLLADLGSQEATGIEADPRLISERVAERIQEACQAPLVADGTAFYASASIGISVFPIDADDEGSLMKNAYGAMYAVKRRGGGTHEMYADTGADAPGRLSFAARLRRAVDDPPWVLHYQPVVEVGSGKAVGLEALLRWQDPNAGLIPPGEFVPVAEEMGLIEAIGDWVVAELGRQLGEWTAAGLRIDASFNLSSRQLHQPELALRIMDGLRTTDVRPEQIVIEIAEAATMIDPDRAQKVMWALHSLGLRLALDDFGTAYSSLARLKHLPVDFLKIDRSLLAGVPDDPDANNMVASIVELARTLGNKALAVGVETEAQRRFLAEHGCPLAQGYLFARAVPADKVPGLFSS